MFEKKRIYIVVKTYPTISTKYSELVCTAGILEDGSWIRLYPVPFRKMEEYTKYEKFTWITANVIRNTKDFRPESYSPDIESIIIESKPKKTDWVERHKFILDKTKIYTNKTELISDAKSSSTTSLAIFKPSKITGFETKEDDREWDDEKIRKAYSDYAQLTIFDTQDDINKDFKVVDKLPYKFFYIFEDDVGEASRLKIEDWEIGALFWNCLKRYNGNEDKAIADVKKKYFDWMLTRDVYLFLGTTHTNHYVSKNPFIIIGVYYPPFQSPVKQLSIFDL